MLKLSFAINVKPGRTMLKMLLMLSYILEIEIFLTYMLLNIWHNIANSNCVITSGQFNKGSPLLLICTLIYSL